MSAAAEHERKRLPAEGRYSASLVVATTRSKSNLFSVHQGGCFLMGRVKRPQPKRLAEKLLQIRTRLELSQNEMIRRMGLADICRAPASSESVGAFPPDAWAAGA